MAIRRWLRDGELIAAAEERFRRVRHWAGFPSQSIAFCLAEAGITLSDVDHVAVNQDSRTNLVGKLPLLPRSRVLAGSTVRWRERHRNFPSRFI